ncbi:Uncharacterised protein [Pandoraea pulmonicola]|uniref:Uncharacterized protein n=1 Tax=Pandoraea pulmonicola TaxID=93221 RepID=A0AAJ5CYI8_PANPU|nr:Uncharacterised protein [Pandoraea pulmonicola]
MTISNSLPAPPSSHPIGYGVSQPQRLPKPHILISLGTLGDGGSGLWRYCRRAVANPDTTVSMRIEPTHEWGTGGDTNLYGRAHRAR